MCRTMIIAAGLICSTSIGANATSPATPVYLPTPPATNNVEPEYPQHSLRLDEEGVVVASFWIEKSGRTSRCAVVMSSGYPRLDGATCIAISKMTFGGSRTEALGPFLKQIRWKFEEPWDGNPALVAIQDLKHGVNRTSPGELPPGRRSNAGLYLTVSAAGAVIQCKVRWGTENPVLDRKACEIASQWRYQPSSQHEGNGHQSKLETVFFADPAAPVPEEETSGH